MGGVSHFKLQQISKIINLLIKICDFSESKFKYIKYLKF